MLLNSITSIKPNRTPPEHPQKIVARDCRILNILPLNAEPYPKGYGTPRLNIQCIKVPAHGWYKRYLDFDYQVQLPNLAFIVFCIRRDTRKNIPD